MTVPPRFLLDTNILIYLIGGSHTALLNRVEAQDDGSVVTSTLCVAEALYGIARLDQRAALNRLLRVIKPQPFDLAAACRFPEVPFRRGKLDRFIAAHALATGLTVVTNNPDDFADIPDLTVENWTR